MRSCLPIGAIHDRPGVYHYAPKEHGLERRADLDPSLWTALMAAFPEGSFLVGLSSIHWREAWKYGERAFRYCQHDVGHALGTMRFAAAALGWRLCLLDRVGDAAISRLLGLNRDADFAGAEREEPEFLALVARGTGPATGASTYPKRSYPGGRFTGRAGPTAESRAQRRLAGDRRGRAGHENPTMRSRRFLWVPSEGELFEPPFGPVLHRRESHPGPQKRGEHGRLDRNLRATFFRMLARSCPPERREPCPGTQFRGARASISGCSCTA